MLTKEVDLEHLHALNLTKEIDKLCSPLKEKLRLKFFNYVHADKDGARFSLSNQEAWFKHYFNLKHYDYEVLNFPSSFPENFSNISLWDGCTMAHKSCKIYLKLQDDFNLGYILFIFSFYKKSAETFGFGFEKSTPHTPQFLHNNLDVFKRFCQYFKDAGEKYIKIAKNQSYHVVIDSNEKYSNPFYWSIDEHQKRQLFNAFKMEKIYLKNEHAHVYLSRPEAQTVLLVVRGYTYDEIAKTLHTSAKTIGYRMEKIRMKLNLTHKKDVVNLLVKEHYLDLIELSIKDC